ncbi:MAG: peptide chain release factor N(5)-glutamine methyltransferase [Acidimicrobiales bacterium]
MTADDGTIEWRRLYDEARQRLSVVSDNADIDARRIVEEAGGFEGAEFVLGLRELVTERGVVRFDRMVERRLQGEPLQYVVGRWGFRTLDLAVDQRVLIPRPETEVVVEEALAELDRIQGTRVLDLGTGSGAIALSIAAERQHTEVWAVERSADALAVARANLSGLGRAAVRVRLVEGTWFDPLDSELAGSFDLIVSNPPYVAADDPLPPLVADWEPTAALVPGPLGTEDVDHIIATARPWLAPEGVLVVERAPDKADWARRRALDAGCERAQIRPDLVERDRMLVASR